MSDEPSENDEFADLVGRVRSGDADAASDLVRRYEADLRSVARVRLTDPALRRVCDSMDVCQSVLANFFVRASAGQYELDSRDDLLNLLATMIRNKVIDYARRQRSQRRDQRRASGSPVDELELASGDESLSQAVANAELLRLFEGQLTDEEKRIKALRDGNASWEEIAAEIGGTAQAVRKRWIRTIDRVSRELKLDER